MTDIVLHTSNICMLIKATEINLPRNLHQYLSWILYKVNIKFCDLLYKHVKWGVLIHNRPACFDCSLHAWIFNLFIHLSWMSQSICYKSSLWITFTCLPIYMSDAVTLTSPPTPHSHVLVSFISEFEWKVYRHMDLERNKMLNEFS